MAPVHAMHGHRLRALNGNHAAAEPASQSLAVRLAPSLSQRRDTKEFDQESFAQLLRTCLESEEDGQTNVDEDPEANHQLICVIVKAALNSDLAGDPFASNRSEDSRIIDSLKVIEQSIKRSPEVLYLTSGPEELGHGNVRVPLFLWLFPQLFSRLGCCKSTLISDSVFQLASTALVAEYGCAQARSSGTAVQEFFQDYVSDGLSTIEKLGRFNQRGDSLEVFDFPDSERFFPQALSKLNLFESVFSQKFSWRSLGSFMSVLLKTINVLALSSLERLAVPGRLMIAKPVLSSVLDQYQRSWRQIGDWLEKSQPTNKVSENLVSLFLTYSHSFYRYTMASPHKWTFAQKADLLRVQWLVDVLKLDYISEDILLQNVCVVSLQQISATICDSQRLDDGVENVLLPALASLEAYDHLRSLSEELKSTIQDVLVSARKSSETSTISDSESRPFRSWTSIYRSLPTAAVSDVRDEIIDNGDNRPRKRRRLSDEQSDRKTLPLFQWLTNDLCRLLGSHEIYDLEGLSGAAYRCFKNLSEDDQCLAMTRLGQVACAGADNLHQSQCGTNLATFQCDLCDADSGRTRDVVHGCDQAEHLFKTLHTLFPVLQKSSKARVAAMLALRKIISHTTLSEYVKLAQNPCGEWCLSSLRSSLRELRLAAGYTLTAFLESRISEDVRTSNLVLGLDFLQTLLGKNEPPILETTVLALSRIAQIAEDEELNIILVRFIELLGHPNPYINALVYNELQKVAQANKKSMWALFNPYWRTLSVPIIKNLQTRPDMAQKVCDLLNIKVADLLVLTKTYTLPHLALTRKQEIIAKIATADDGTTPGLLCQERHNLAAILALLLAQPSADSEGMIMSILLDISEDFKHYDVAHWLRTEPMLISCHLLTAVVDAGEGSASKIHQGLYLLASFVRGSSHSSNSRKQELVGSFIESHILGIITEFSHTITDFQVKQPLSEKRRSLGAIGEMIKVAKDHVRPALPQICGCLRTAIEDKELCDRAFAAWATLMTSLSEELVEPLIDQTLALVVRSWHLLKPSSQEKAHSLIGNILQSHTSTVRDLASVLPSLASIPVMAKYEAEIGKLRAQFDVKHQFLAFSRRCQSDNLALVEQGLHELVPYLEQNQAFLHRSVLSEQPDQVVADLARSLLDCCVNLGPQSETVADLCGQSLGILGSLDPNRVESTKEKKDVLVLQNFAKADETVDFILFFLQHVLVKAFLSASNSRSQGFLAWAMQELLSMCALDATVLPRIRESESNPRYRRWLEIPEAERNILTPFLSSRYTISVGAFVTTCSYPLFTPKLSHGEWLRTIVLDMLQKGPGDNVQLIYFVCSRIIRYQDASISSFLLPFVALNLIIAGTEREKADLTHEILNILDTPLSDDTRVNDSIRLCSESIFQILDYLSKWIGEKKKLVQAALSHSNRGHADPYTEKYQFQILSVEQVLQSVPSGDISRRALECKSYARALFYWEQEIRERKKSDPQRFEANKDYLLGYLQEVYTHIDEPDGIEGISSQLNVLSIDQQVLEHRKAGRWTSAQSWYNLQLREDPTDVDLQVNLLSCLKEAGQCDIILSEFDALRKQPTSIPRILPFATEASWVCGQWDKMRAILEMAPDTTSGEYNVGLAKILDHLRDGNLSQSKSMLRDMRLASARTLTTTNTSSIAACHDILLQLHVIAEMSGIVDLEVLAGSERKSFSETLDRRLDVLGVHLSDKQYILGVRRATMQLCGKYSGLDIASAWLTSARLARKGNSLNEAFNAVLRAAQLGDKSATIENARLLWKDGHHRKAIQSLEGAIKDDLFMSHNFVPEDGPTTLTSEQQQQQNLVTARAHLLLAKWLDTAGQTPSDVIVERYRKSISSHRRWDKAHYYLGRHYNKILESEKAKAPGKETQTYLSGETAKLVIENYLRSLMSGSKYVFQTLPKILTLWLELTAAAEQSPDPRRGNNEKFQAYSMMQKKKVMEEVHAQVKKYIETRLTPAILYPILPQVVARICHTNNTVYNILVTLVVRVVKAFPQQALWSLLAVVKSSSRDRASRGIHCVNKVLDSYKKSGKDGGFTELSALITQGQKLADELLRVCERHIEGKPSKLSLFRDFGFNHKNAPSRLVIPLETALMPSTPSNTDSSTLKTFRAFPKDAVTISAFLDEVLILASLQKPRKLNVRGSDGKIYGLLCKPKDDLRKDQRLMEFNNMINRFLKKDVESSKRRLYIKTYAVTPLNEECGLIEWVDGLKTFRDILLRIYKERGIHPNYNEIRSLLEEACSDPSRLHLFQDRVIATFPPVFHEWFIEMFPSPGAWFQARLKYTRSCAVMSMTGHVLGLGDRHGENILFEEGNGGTFHVDFNCLFDKGLTFEKPELVPFRLTHNMIDAFGAYGYNGPFRRSCELTLGLLRQNEDALMTILETFLHDPTTDFIGKKKRSNPLVPETPEGVLDSVRNKLRGLLPSESVPLSVGGYVEHLIIQATNPKNLAAMYIGWCAFF